jgi:hypothetical protein
MQTTTPDTLHRVLAIFGDPKALTGMRKATVVGYFPDQEIAREIAEHLLSKPNIVDVWVSAESLQATTNVFVLKD